MPTKIMHVWLDEIITVIAPFYKPVIIFILAIFLSSNHQSIVTRLQKQYQVKLQNAKLSN